MPTMTAAKPVLHSLKTRSFAVDGKAGNTLPFPSEHEIIIILLLFNDNNSYHCTFISSASKSACETVPEGKYWVSSLATTPDCSGKKEACASANSYSYQDSSGYNKIIINIQYYFYDCMRVMAYRMRRQHQHRGAWMWESWFKIVHELYSQMHAWGYTRVCRSNSVVWESG